MSLYDFADICAVLPEHLSCARFEGMLEKHLMYRHKGKMLFWTMEHYADKSYGDYEVMIDGKSQYFKRLSDAVKCFNGG